MKNYVEVSGRTYAVKEKLKNLGLVWDSDRKLWKGTVSENDLKELDKLADKFQIEIKTRELTHEDEQETVRYRYTNKYTNSKWVRCWVCGRLIPPGRATKDVSGQWYCGC
ncbi:MAG: hypothetical protein P3W91_000640 [Fervidobacterium sp.]|nr:hypothetical protein [Fervidobacterium sp.]